MNTERNPETILAAWLDEGPTDLPDVTRRAITAALPTTKQRRRPIWAPWRFDRMPISLRLVAAAVIGVLALGIIYLNLPGRGDVGGPPSPTLTPMPTQSVVELGTITLTQDGCIWSGNPGSIVAALEPVVGMLTVVNETDTFANLGIYRLDDGYPWADAAAWVVAENDALHGGPSHAPANFVTDVGSIDAPERRQYPGRLSLSPGTHGVLCSSNEPPPGLVFAVYLAGPLEITISD